MESLEVSGAVRPPIRVVRRQRVNDQYRDERICGVDVTKLCLFVL